MDGVVEFTNKEHSGSFDFNPAGVLFTCIVRLSECMCVTCM